MEISYIVSLLGFTGAILGGYAYVPQIIHLANEKCSAGISIRAFQIWTLSSTLVLINALYIGAPVFIFICMIQLSASFTILLLSIRSKDHVCQTHLHIDSKNL